MGVCCQDNRRDKNFMDGNQSLRARLKQDPVDNVSHLQIPQQNPGLLWRNFRKRRNEVSIDGHDFQDLPRVIGTWGRVSIFRYKWFTIQVRWKNKKDRISQQETIPFRYLNAHNKFFDWLIKFWRH